MIAPWTGRSYFFAAGAATFFAVAFFTFAGAGTFAAFFTAAAFDAANANFFAVAALRRARVLLLFATVMPLLRGLRMDAFLVDMILGFRAK